MLAILLSFHFVWAEAQSFQKMVKEFQQSAITDFIGFTLKGERYPLMHTISELRFRVFTEKLGINRKAETKACSRRRTFGTEVPEDQKNSAKTTMLWWSSQKEASQTLPSLKKFISTPNPHCFTK